MRINKKALIILLSSVFCLLSSVPAFAAAAVSVTAGTPWAIGTKGASTATTSGTMTVKNDASGGTENITISVGNSASWTPSATSSPGNNQFVLQLTNAAGAVITGAAQTLVSGLTNNATSDFVLYFTTPTAGSAGEGVQQSITVTLTATNWVKTCSSGGWLYAGECWYNGASGNSCTTICSTLGGSAAQVALTWDQQLAICQNWYPSNTRYIMNYAGNYSPHQRTTNCDTYGNTGTQLSPDSPTETVVAGTYRQCNCNN